MFVLLVLVGCLTQERFEREWSPSICAGLEACGEDPADRSIDCEGVRDPLDCATWDAEAAQACLDSLEESCGSDTPECDELPFCGR